MSLLEMSGTAAIMIIVIVIIRAITIHRLPKKTFVLLWGIVVLGLLLPFRISSIFSIYSFLNQNTIIEETTLNIVNPITTYLYSSAENKEKPLESTTLTSSEQSSISLWYIIWIIGVFFCAIFFTVSYIRCQLKFQTSFPVKNEFIHYWLTTHKLKRSIEIRQSSCIKAPLTYGIYRPIILMPKNTDWDNEKQLQYILTHKYIHIKQDERSLQS